MNEYSETAATELVVRGLAVIEERHEYFGRKRGGREFSRTRKTVRLLTIKDRICTPVTVEIAAALLA